MREIERRRAAFAHKVQEVEDAEFETIEPKAIVDKKGTKNRSMTSARKVKTNRANARASTGPKTPEGKARAAQNARRHGLSLPILVDPLLSAEAENLAREIAGKKASSEFLNSRSVLPKRKSITYACAKRIIIFSREISTICNMDMDPKNFIEPREE